jgi:hypothetical protein
MEMREGFKQKFLLKNGDCFLIMVLFLYILIN